MEVSVAGALHLVAFVLVNADNRLARTLGHMQTENERFDKQLKGRKGNDRLIAFKHLEYHWIPVLKLNADICLAGTFGHVQTENESFDKRLEGRRGSDGLIAFKHLEYHQIPVLKLLAVGASYTSGRFFMVNEVD